MSDILEITRKAPENKSMNYEFLRQEGIKYIQELSSKIWTDYNVHDPGITILEALCYAITDLGNRASYPIEDIIAIEDSHASDEDKIKNFYKAEQILPNAPLTLNDYRKLLMDIQIEVPVPGSDSTELVGIKNAWLKKASDAEEGFYLHKADSLLSYDKDPTLSSGIDQTILYAGNLYNVLLEFSHSKSYDDLNHNTIDGYLTIYDNPEDTKLEGLVVSIDITLPRWDNEEIDWDNPEEIKTNIQKINVDFINLPSNYELTVNIDEFFNVSLEGKVTLSSGAEVLTNLSSIEEKINAFLYNEMDQESLILVYLQKIYIIHQILEEVEKTLNANRNLCDDFLLPEALKIEEIGICADIQIEPDSNIEEILAQVYYHIGRFLSPTVNFYTLSEMLDLCISEKSYTIKDIDTEDGFFTVNADLTEKLQVGDTITIKDSLSNDADYTVTSLNINNLNDTYSDVYVDEDIASDVLTEGETFNYNVTNENDCLTVDKIFEGPLLKHGFIDNDELEDADLMEVIHVSDLIQIIMDIPGVTAIRNLEIASYPEDPEYDTELKSVKWVLELLYKDNYVPRLSMDKSTVVFYKDQIPFKANKKEVEELVNDLITSDRPQKLTPPIIYPKVPKGTYNDLSEYSSIQDDFPLHFGIGFEGIPNLSNLSNEDQLKKIGQTRQLKAYLMFFDQLLTNYMAQLANVKYLFSMNAEKDENGEYEVGRTYYTQALFDSVSDSDPLYINKEGHEAELELIAENESLFNARRNKFLDHLLARFAENFTDYAMLITRLSGEKAPRELIDDKLNFLNKYPEISANRGLAMNCRNSCKFWHLSNNSGLEKRSSLLMGIAEHDGQKLVFSNDFKITQDGEVYKVSIATGATTLIEGTSISTSESEAAEMIESILIHAVQEENYEVISEDGINFAFQLVCENEILAESYKSDYNSPENTWADIDILMDICKNEFFYNPESNRKNLTPPIDNYFEYSYTLVADDVNYYDVIISLYRLPFGFTEDNKLLTCSFQINEEDIDNVDDLEKTIKDFIWKTIIHGTDSEYYIFSYPDAVSVPDPDYVFQITDRNSIVLATSAEKNFNEKLVSYISGLNEPMVKISGSSGNDGYYTIDSSDSDGPNVIINIPLDNPIPSTTSDGNLSLTATYACDINASEKYFMVNFDITEDVFENNVVTLLDNDGTTSHFVVDDVSLSDGKTKIETSDSLPSDTSGTLTINSTCAYSLDEDNKTFTIDEDITGSFIANDIVSMWKENELIQEFTIKRINRYGDKTQIVVNETIDSDPRGMLSFTKIYAQVRIDNPDSSSGTLNEFTIKGGEDTKAVQEMIQFIKNTFTEKEGLHLIEHVLLRPKNNDNIPILTGGLASFGNVIFGITVPAIVNDSVSERIGVDGDISSAIFIHPDSSTLTIEIEGFTFEISSDSIEYIAAENTTYFDLSEVYPSELDGMESIHLTYQSAIPIADVDEEIQKIFPESSEHTFSIGEQILVVGSEDALNDGTFTIDSVDEDGFLIKLELLQDKLLPVFLSDDCSSYSLSNPYTSIATVVLPYWPERFNNTDFRNFFEETLRLESPSHVLLKICWINPMHMEDFEREFKNWLLLSNSSSATQQEISEALSQLIDAIDKLRNVYPVGTLYDPEEHETLKNTIILNNTMLGSF